ncbi:UNVERIFIED_CONTAM: hypothetical protein Slati_3841700 [Sesamum latifolium]|uniref:Uncharacterized protein n=1 Tax=Sesamum latifolium TaxID=2727402 RepID=A0AAW2TL95_9LAMI
MIEFQSGETEWVKSFTAICLKIMISGTDWKELEPDTSKISQDIQTRKDQGRPWNSTSSTPEGEGHRGSKAKDQRGSNHFIHQIHKIIKVEKADLSDLEELVESFSQLRIVELVNVQTNKITPILPPPEGSTSSNDPPQDHLMRESMDFHTNATPTFVGTRFKENPWRNPKRVLEHTPWERIMLQPLHPYGTILNLDIIDFRNTEKLIDAWVAALKIAATTLELDREIFIRVVELSLEGSMNIGWDNTPEDTKANILAGDSKSAIVERLGRLTKIHLSEMDTSKEVRQKAREYTQTLFGLELRSICAIDE